MFNETKPAPPDSILGLTEAFRADSNPAKVNLGVGIYKDEQGATPIMAAVKAAEKHLLETQTTKSYLPIPGSPAYSAVVQKLLFGSDSSVFDRARTCHTPGGTGALRVGGDFIKKLNPNATVWVSTPTWANHKGVFGAAGLNIADYRYYDAATNGLDFSAMKADLENVPAGDIVLLHVCCHNPTGVDLEATGWAELASIAKTKGWIPFFDFAYHGFADGLEQDRAAFTPFIDAGIEFFVANSYSKNFGLYNERTGGLTVVAETADAVDAAFSHVKKTIRTNYSNPSNHGGAIVSTILESAELTQQWETELAEMRVRIHSMRKELVDGIKNHGIDRDFGYIVEQRGMFSYSGLSDENVQALRDKSIYVVGGGRINVAGLTPSNIDAVCAAVADVL